MLRFASTTAILAALCMPAVAQGAMSSARMQSAIPANSVTVTNWYKQSVYDPSDNKIGEIMDVLVDKAGHVTSLIVGVGGFLGAGEKDVAVSFDAVQHYRYGQCSTEALYTLYAPPNHRDGVVHHPRDDAEADNEHFDGKTTE
jgi:sporulation protein YlmC with PRC-barrel domain